MNHQTTPIPSHADVVIIGSGAGGSTLAYALASSGLRILILERGGFIPRERENWDEHAVFAQRRYQAPETWYDREGRPFSPYTHYCVGGNTKVYGAALLRLRESDFGEVRHFAGVSPAWPISYHDLEPYYLRAERLYSVHGQRGSDPCEPRASAPFPFPPLDPEPRIRELFDDFAASGLRPFPIPLGVRPRPPFAAPILCRTFDGYPDITETKSDAHVSALAPALRHPRVTLVTGAKVERLLTSDDPRRVDRIEFTRDGVAHAVSADTVVLACGAVNSAALLLRSASPRHPNGLANSSGLVGRHYMTHQNGCFVAVMDSPNPSLFQKHFGLTDFYHRAPDSPFPLGTVQLMGKPDRATLEWLRGDRLPGVPLDDIIPRTIDFFLTAEDLPHPDNRVSLRPDGSIRIDYTPNNTEAYDRLQATLTSLLHRIETRHARRPPVILASRLGISGVSHQCGTLRFGADPARSVLDTDCRAHDLDNLYAVDSSFFPSSGAVNPSLTIMANALRVGERLLQRLTGRSATPQEALA